jgi:hypothetical protein
MIPTFLLRYLARTRSLAPLAVFRIIVGFCVSFSTIRFIGLGWVEEQYIAPKIHFHYYGFEWVKGVEYFGEFGLFALFTILLISAVCVMLGAWYRVASVIMFLVFTYIELLDVTYYLNHYYFVSIIAGMMTLLPAHRLCSVDCWRNPSLRREQVPAWIIDILKVQIAIVYVYAGLAKITTDWLFHALPLSIWLPAHDQLPFVGHYFREQWLSYVFSWCGMFFDCTVPFFLLWRRTRVFAYVAVVVFHSITGWMFQIGVFPLVMSLCVLLFFSDEFHLKVVTWIEKILRLNNKETSTSILIENTRNDYQSSLYRTILPLVFTVHLIFQLLFPWRYILYPGNMFWTEQGYRFGWRVMLMEKAATATFYVRDSISGREGIIDNSEFLNTHQEKQMAMQPDMIIQYAQYLRNIYQLRGINNPSIRAEVWVTLNARPSRLLFDPQLNLATIEDTWANKWWLNSHE